MSENVGYVYKREDNYGEKRCLKFFVFVFIDLLQVVRARVFIVYSQNKEGACANADQLFKLLWPKVELEC